jgi:hypothetical protein
MISISFNLSSAADRAFVAGLLALPIPEVTETFQPAALPETSGKKTAEKPNPADKFTVYRPDGTKRAGFSHSKDALSVLKIELEESVKTEQQMSDFGQHNRPCMSKLTKEDQVTMQGYVAAKVKELKAASDPTGNAGAPSDTPPSTAGGETTTQVSQDGAGTGQTATSDASPSEGSTSDEDLAKLFAGDKIAEVAAENAVSKEDFVKAMMAAAKALGAQEASAWLKSEKLDTIGAAKPEQYAALIESATKRIAELKGA